MLRIIQKIKFVLGLKLIDGNGKKNLNMMKFFSMKKEGEITSFISVKKEQQLLDLLFTHPDFVRQGLAQNLLDFILKTYLHNEIYTFASLSAKDFFLKNGFELIRENKVIKEGQNLKNFLMKKDVV